MLFTADRPILVAWNFPLTSMKLYDCCFHCPLLQCIQGGCACRTSYNKKKPGASPRPFPLLCKVHLSPSLSFSLARNCKRKNVNLSRASPNIILCLPAVNQTKPKKQQQSQEAPKQARTRFIQTCASHRALRENFSPSPRSTQ